MTKRDISSMSTVAFTIAKVQKQPKCPSVNEGTKEIWCIYKMEYYSAMRRKEILPFVTSLELESIFLSKISSGKERQTLYNIIYMWNLEKLNSQKHSVMVAKGWGLGEMAKCWSKDTEYQLEMSKLF